MVNKFEIDWVLKNELAVGRAPKLEEDLIYLRKNGIVSILSLCSEKEAKLPKNIQKNFNFTRYVLPDHKYDNQLTLDQLRECLDILEKIKLHGPVYVHCVASIERSPLLCMAWLIKNHNLDPFQSLDYLMQVHKGTNPLPLQFDLLKYLKRN